MAGDWIKFELATSDKPEVYAMAEKLGIAPETVVGHLLRIWGWADQQSLAGNALSVTKKAIDRISRLEGLADAMLFEHWLNEKNGVMSFPHFDRHNGKTAKMRALTNKRVAEHRDKTSNASSVTKSLPEKRREESTSSATQLRAAKPPQGNGKEQPNSAETWEAYSRAYFARYDVSPVRNAAVNSQLAALVKRLGVGEAPAVAAWYCQHNASKYIGAAHSTKMLLQDAEKLRTEWATGRQITQTAATNADRRQANRGVFTDLIQEAENAKPKP